MAARLLAIAHRAGNDLAGLRAALDAGVDLVEADVRLFRGELEIRHTRTLGGRLLWDRWGLARRRHAIVPRLADVLAAMPGDARIMLDLKRPRAMWRSSGADVPARRSSGADVPARRSSGADVPGQGRSARSAAARRGQAAVAAKWLAAADDELAVLVADALREAALGLPVTVCSKHWRMLDHFDPPVRRVLSAASRPALARLRSAVARPTDVFGVSVRLGLLTPRLVGELRRRVEHVLAWPVDTEDDLAEARWLGVTGVIGKNLPLLRRVLAEP